MKNIFCCPALELFHCLVSTPVDNSEATWKKATKCNKQFYIPNMQEQSKMGKKQKSKDKHSSFDGLIQENIDLSDIY